MSEREEVKNTFMLDGEDRRGGAEVIRGVGRVEVSNHKYKSNYQSFLNFNFTKQNR